MQPEDLATESSVTYMKSSTAAGRHGGQCVSDMMAHLADALAKAEAELGHIDAVAGDGDHGQGMARGSAAARAAASKAAASGAGPATVLSAAADAWADRAGGTSGALWGEGLRAFSLALEDNALPSAQHLAFAALQACAHNMSFDRAKLGETLLIIAIAPFVERF